VALLSAYQEMILKPLLSNKFIYYKESKKTHTTWKFSLW